MLSIVLLLLVSPFAIKYVSNLVAENYYNSYFSKRGITPTRTFKEMKLWHNRKKV